jgi:hypothetical protein
MKRLSILLTLFTDVAGASSGPGHTSPVAHAGHQLGWPVASVCAPTVAAFTVVSASEISATVARGKITQKSAIQDISLRDEDSYEKNYAELDRLSI